MSTVHSPSSPLCCRLCTPSNAACIPPLPPCIPLLSLLAYPHNRPARHLGTVSAAMPVHTPSASTTVLVHTASAATYVPLAYHLHCHVCAHPLYLQCRLCTASVTAIVPVHIPRLCHRLRTTSTAVPTHTPSAVNPLVNCAKFDLGITLKIFGF